MDNAIQLATIQDIRDHINDMVIGAQKTFICPPDFTNAHITAILCKLVWDRGIAYGIKPGASSNEFIIYTTDDAILLR